MHESTDIDVIAADRAGKQFVAGECKYRENFDESEALAKLEHRSALVKGFSAKALYLFTKRPVSDATLAKHAENPALRFVTLDEMYALE